MLYTSMGNGFQQQHFSLRAPSASIASTKAAVMGLSLHAHCSAHPVCFLTNGGSHGLLLYSWHLWEHKGLPTSWFTARNSEQKISQSKPCCLTGGGFYLLCEVTVAYMLKCNTNRTFVSANRAFASLQIHLSAILVKDIAHAFSKNIINLQMEGKRSYTAPPASCDSPPSLTQGKHNYFP